MKKTSWVWLFSIVFFPICFSLKVNNSIYFVRPGNLIHALANAKKGDTIILTKGVYHGNFVINQSITLKSTHGATLNGEFSGTTLTIHAPHVSVQGITITGSGTSIAEHDACVLANNSSTDFNMMHNQLKHCLFGIRLQSVRNANISDNRIKGTTQKNLSERGNAIELWSSKGVTVRNNQITQGRDALYVSDSSHINIRNNMMNHVRFGLHFMYSQHVVIYHNTVVNSIVGMALMYSEKLHIKSNHVKNNQTHGFFLLQINDSIFTRNLAENNADGISLTGSNDNLIRNNQIQENKYGVVIGSGSQANTVYNNNFIHNRLQVNYRETETTYWGYQGRGNFWSNYQGFERNHSGIGSSVFYVNNLGQWLSFSFPILNVMFDSPIMEILQKIENTFPVLRRTALIDKYPLTQRVPYAKK